MLQKIKSSINAKFLATFFLLLLIPFFIITQLFVTQLRSVLREKELSSISEKVGFAGSQLNRIYSDMDRIAASLIVTYKVTDILADTAPVPTYDWFTGYKSMNSILTLLSSNTNYQYSITIISHDNTIYQSGQHYNSMLKSDSPLVSAVQNSNGNPVIFNRALEGFDDNQLITLGRAIYQKGHYLGTILVEVPISYLDKQISHFESTATQLYVLEDNSRIIYSSQPSQLVDIPTDLQTALNSQSDSVTLDNTEYLLQQIPVQQGALSLVVLVTTDSVFQESSLVVQAYILRFALIIAATLIGITILTTFFTRDIKALNAEVSRFGNDTDTEIGLPVHSCDEIGQLTDGVNSMSHRINCLLLQIQENEHNKRILEFNSLQTQINPHMIYNTLNTITYLAEMQNVSNIQEVSSSFAYLLRSLSNQGEFISVSQEIEYLKSFLAIKKYNLLSPIQTDYQVDKEALNCRILKLILQPIVENAVIHGFSNRLDDCLLCISIRCADNLLKIDVSDNGNGMDEECIQRILTGEEKNKNTFLRVGIKNIIDRLSLQYGKSASFSIDSAPDCGTTVHISFPAEYSEPTAD